MSDGPDVKDCWLWMTCRSMTEKTLEAAHGPDVSDAVRAPVPPANNEVIADRSKPPALLGYRFDLDRVFLAFLGLPRPIFLASAERVAA